MHFVSVKAADLRLIFCFVSFLLSLSLFIYVENVVCLVSSRKQALCNSIFGNICFAQSAHMVESGL